MTDMQIIQNFLEGVQESGKTTTAYDTTAEVIRVDENSVWVHIPGGVAETPVARTINAKKGDVVQVRVSGGTAFIVGNATAPPTDDAVAIVAQGTAEEAKEVADAATISAEIAAVAADSAQASADSAAASAATANTAANNALTQLSTVEDVVGILNWISQHGEYQASTDTAVVPGKFYFTRSGSGTSGDPYVYTVVENPTGNPSTSGYYELLDVDEAVAAFVSSHLVLVNDGLYVIGTANGWKALVSSGDGNYPAGFYLINPSGNTSFLATPSGVTFYGDNTGSTELAHLGYDYGTPASGSTPTKAPYYSLGPRASGSDIGNYSVAEGYLNTAKGYISHAEGSGTTAQGYVSHAEGYDTEAEGTYSHAEGESTTAQGRASHAEGANTTALINYAHAEGYYAEATGVGSHAEGEHTTASGTDSHTEGYYTYAANYCHAGGYHTEARKNTCQTVVGKYNDNQNDTLFEVGNGTADDARSNAFQVHENGNVAIGGALTDMNGNTLLTSAGQAVKAVGDKNGNDITTTYAPLNISPTWTAPTYNSSRGTTTYGGYYKRGRTVYVQLVCVWNGTDGSTTNTGNNIGFITNFPKPYNFVALSCINRSKGNSLVGCWAENSGNSIRLCWTAGGLATGDTLYISGTYISAS